MRTVLILLAAMLVVPLGAANVAPVTPRDAPILSDVLPAVGGEEPIVDISNRWIVGFHEMIDTSSGHYGPWRIVDESANLAFVTVEAPDAAAFEAHTAADANVKYVEHEQWHSVLYTPTDPFWGVSDYTWGFGAIGATTAWDRTLGSTTAKVCILDTGLLKTHVEFSGTGRVAQGWDTVYEDNDPNDNNGHGTHVAGIVAARINAYGIPGTAQAYIVPIRVLNTQGQGTTTDIAQGYDLCRTNGAHVASASLGGGYSSTIATAVSNYRNAGGLAIAATGNDGCACTSYPAGYTGVVGVGAVASNLARASFSNTGSAVDLVAPGVAIVSSYITVSGCTANQCYVYSDGTSMATPFVSGVAALVKTRYPTWSAASISSRLTSTAQDLGAAGWDSSYGYGLVRADSATV